jgi:hypothetical protein
MGETEQRATAITAAANGPEPLGITAGAAPFRSATLTANAVLIEDRDIDNRDNGTRQYLHAWKPLAQLMTDAHRDMMGAPAKRELRLRRIVELVDIRRLDDPSRGIVALSVPTSESGMR